MTIQANNRKTGKEYLLGLLHDAEVRVGNAHYVVGKIDYILSEPQHFDKKALIEQLHEIRRILLMETDIVRDGK